MSIDFLGYPLVLGHECLNAEDNVVYGASDVAMIKSYKEDKSSISEYIILGIEK